MPEARARRRRTRARGVSVAAGAPARRLPALRATRERRGRRIAYKEHATHQATPRHEGTR
eukprot:scaffold5980_cov376-Prasinococcus_capsulatus_cf.AAC.4